MKTVKVVKLMAGPDGVFQPGDVIQVDDQTADALVKNHAAELVKAVSQKTESAEETATLEAPERAVKPAAKRRQAPKK